MTSPQDASSSSPNPYESVIGILTHPRTLNGEIKPDSIIRKSYVKFVKSAGARAIPLIYNEDPNELRKKLDLVNGVLLTGGRAINHGKDVKTEKEVVVEKYAETVRSIFEYVKKRNGEGKDYFPLYGICLGFELITKIVSEDDDILENFDADDYASNLDFAKEEALKGSIFESFPTESLDKLCDDPIVYQNHDHGISPKKFSENKNLQRLFVILTTSKDKKKEKEYVSTMRSCEYPITLFQWHPEKIEFEWGSPNIPRTCGAIRVSRLAAAFLVREADKSSKRPDSQELKQLIDYLKLIDDRRIRRRQDGNVEVYLFEASEQ